MAVKGAIAKQVVIEKIKQAFATDFVAVVDNKVYVQADENGEKVQIAISLTCPKVPVGTVKEESTVVAGEPSTFQPAQIDERELENVRALIKEFNL